MKLGTQSESADQALHAVDAEHEPAEQEQRERGHAQEEGPAGHQDADAGDGGEREEGPDGGHGVQPPAAQPDERGQVQHVPPHGAAVGDPVQAVGHERVAVAGEEVVALVLEAPRPRLQRVVPRDRRPGLRVLVGPRAHVRRQVGREAALGCHKPRSKRTNSLAVQARKCYRKVSTPMNYGQNNKTGSSKLSGRDGQNCVQRFGLSGK